MLAVSAESACTLWGVAAHNPVDDVSALLLLLLLFLLLVRVIKMMVVVLEYL